MFIVILQITIDFCMKQINLPNNSIKTLYNYKDSIKGSNNHLSTIIKA